VRFHGSPCAQLRGKTRGDGRWEVVIQDGNRRGYR
jgi:hypothetical protein